MGRSVVSFAGVVLALAGAASVVSAQDYDFDWVTIGDVGNAPYDGDSPYGPPYAVGRGGVDYEYRIGRTEVTTGQWMEFVNTFSTQSDGMATFAWPFHWGARIDPDYDGPGRRYVLRDVESAEMLPVGGISWREAGMFCNWLHNDKSADLSALESGAYDTSTWGDDGSFFTDDPTHLPGAKYWIPTLDEALKARNYDPNRYGEGEGGWWLYPNMSDEPPIPGLPGEGTTSAGLQLPFHAEWDIPLGAYTDQVSAWGLWDTSGGASEWNEEIVPPGLKANRMMLGSYAGYEWYVTQDHVSVGASGRPGSAGIGEGIRIATTVPSPAGLLVVVLYGGGIAGRLNRRR
jgi:hypothetical protein